MVCKIKNESGVSRLLFALIIGSIPIMSTFFAWSFRDLIYFYIVYVLFLILAHQIQYELTIGDGFLFTQRALFGKSFYKKRIDLKQIKQIKFVRVGWRGRKGATIQMKKGLNIQITDYAPDSVITDLMEFANEYGIHIEKTKDFLILEKWNM